MAKSSVGSLNVFNHETQDWTLYKGRLEQWFEASDVVESTDKLGSKRRAILLSSLAETTYRLTRDLALPKDVGKLTYDEVVALLDGHFKVKKCGFAERFKFHCAIQESDETLSQWAARVRGLAMDCGFPTCCFENALRDRFVLGMAAGPERDRLFSEPMDQLVLQSALQLADSVRCAREGARQVAAPAPPPPPAPLDVHRVQAGAAGRAAAPSTSSRSTEQCPVCGYNGHGIKTCRFRNFSCRKCGEKGHLRRVCDGKKCNIMRNSHFLQCCSEGGDDGKRFVFNIRSYRGEPMQELVKVNDVQLSFEVDTGSAVTAISDCIYNEYFANHPLCRSNKTLQSYNGSRIETLGTIILPFSFRNETKNIEVFVVKGGGPPLLGRDFISQFNLQICPVNQFSVNNLTELELMKQYPLLFSDRLGCCKGVEVKLNLKSDAKPIYFKSRSVPFALRAKLEQELDRMVGLGIIEPVTFSEYASPIVPVLRQDGRIRVCADYSATLNTQLLVEKYPLPRIEELFSKLHGGQQFSKLDLSGAYNQLLLSKESQMLTCINTHKGLYKYSRLVFGLSSAPAIFQRTLENILSGIDGVLQFIDDILITGKDREEHLARLHEVFNRLEKSGLVLSKEKCSFFQDSVSYLGFIIDKHGLHKSPDKIKAIVDAKRPENVTELKSFLGLVNYYRSFIKNASSILTPLHNLLRKDAKWGWEEDHESAFSMIKKELASDTTLAHFNPDARIILTVDASPWGLAAILSQVEDDGKERPVYYASRSLIAAEKQYSQIQKEATAIIFGVRKFHHYLYGRSVPFVLRTDHKPLLSIFSPEKGIPEFSANRLQRYALFLSAYNYVIEYVNSAHNCADFLSRSMMVTSQGSSASGGGGPPAEPVFDDSSYLDNANYVNFIWEPRSAPNLVSDVSRATQSDCILSKVLQYTKTGWPIKIFDKELRPFFDCRSELAIEKGCIMRGTRLVVPNTLRSTVINELHTGHLGFNKMRADAACRFWWPGLGASLRRAVDACAVCRQLLPAPPRAPLTPWPFPPTKFHRVHLDFLGPLNNKMYMIAVDAFSKWVEVYDVSTGYGSRVVIEKLCDYMARYGLIHTLVSDNGPSFISKELEIFCHSNGITLITSPAYHPASNGQAESSVKIVKKGIKSILLSGSKNVDINVKLNEFLFHYRNSWHSTTNCSPAEVLFGSKLRCRLDLLNPLPPPASDSMLREIVKSRQSLQIKYYRGRRNITFSVGDLVLVKVHQNKNTIWSKGVIFKRLGKSAYLVKLVHLDKIIKRHSNQIYELKGEGGENDKEDQAVCSSSGSYGRTDSPENAWSEEICDSFPPPIWLSVTEESMSSSDRPEGTEQLTATDVNTTDAENGQGSTTATADPEQWVDCQEGAPAADAAASSPEANAAAPVAPDDIPEERSRPRRHHKPIDYKKYF